MSESLLSRIASNRCIGHDLRKGCPDSADSFGMYYHCRKCLDVYMRRYDKGTVDET